LALALVLLAGAGLLVKTVIRTFAVTLTYDPSRVLVGDIELADRRYEDPGRIRLFADGIRERLARMEGVRSAVSRQAFFAGFGGQARRIEVAAQSPKARHPRSTTLSRRTTSESSGWGCARAGVLPAATRAMSSS
jgi:hypothetical protein